MFRSLLIICIISFLGIGCEKKNDGKDPIASLFGSSGAGLLLAAAIQTGSNFNRANCGFSAIDLPEGSYEAHPGTTGSNSSSLSATNRLNHWGFQEFIPPSFGTYTVTSNLLGNLTTVDGDIYLWKNRCPLSESASVGAFNDADGDLGSDEITFDQARPIRFGSAF
ncbi:hypothetical protein CH379_008540 [Leptospira ellisii]|uniref:Uncharacterized protein n=1 Tax=Leptospira ellisii TaxID=2023197 RepID=A0AAE4TZH2_9LEPT|nr:hypothetical protein [Leptospira ellisii]MDV6235671.1 hypothetical protein [Leptospira ellisii]